MNDEKVWWQSRTIIGIVVMLLAQALKWLKVDIVNEELTDIVTLAMESIGAGLAIYGRVKARKTLRRTKPGGQFNPNAEVRKAKPVRSKLLGLFILLLSVNCYAQFAGNRSLTSASTLSERLQPYPYYVWYESPIKFQSIVDERPFLIRLLDSLWISVSVLPVIKGEVKGQADF